jgi:type II secretory pathway pseudopilin PulG
MTRRRTRRAFTLPEAITGVVILSIAIPSMLWGVRQAHIHRANRILLSRAHWLAVEQLEDVLADRAGSTRGYSYIIPGNYPPEPAVAGFPAFARSVMIAETGASLAGAGTGYKRITVIVSFTDAGGTPRSLSLQSAVTDYSP